ncbi:MAG: hypothetical protein CTY16_13835 [Methylobacter sp.]|nr:MAG: hypothetical protein CTY16_13835 [Methylobacter sp.]
MPNVKVRGCPLESRRRSHKPLKNKNLISRNGGQSRLTALLGMMKTHLSQTGNSQKTNSDSLTGTAKTARPNKAAKPEGNSPTTVAGQHTCHSTRQPQPKETQAAKLIRGEASPQKHPATADRPPKTTRTLQTVRIAQDKSGPTHETHTETAVPPTRRIHK